MTQLGTIYEAPRIAPRAGATVVTSTCGHNCGGRRRVHTPVGAGASPALLALGASAMYRGGAAERTIAPKRTPPRVGGGTRAEGPFGPGTAQYPKGAKGGGTRIIGVAPRPTKPSRSLADEHIF